jgi:spermidine synthase
MGMLFGRWVQYAGETRGGVGLGVASNCAGAALAAPMLLGWLVPHLGLKGSLVGVSAGYLLLVPWSAWREWRWLFPLCFVGLAAGVPLGVEFLELPERATVVRSWDGRMASVAVIRTQDEERVLRVNNHFQQGGTATAVAARRHAHIPLLLHPAPRTVLFLGIGTGITMGAAADHPGLVAEGVELLPEVVEALALFEPENRSVARREGFEVRIGDARRHVRTVKETYDVIIADLFHPGEDGAGMLYTREHFQAIRGCLAPGGLFCQWLPLHQLDEAGFRDVGATFLEVFPEASLWLLRFNVDIPVVGLVGGQEPWRVRPDDLVRRMGAGALSPALKPVALGDPARLLGCRIADAMSLRNLTTGGRVATDDLPRVLYGAAASAYRHGAAPHERLLRVLAAAEPGFKSCLAEGSDAGWLRRLESFRLARDRHLHGLGEELSGRMRQALEDYVESSRLSPEYTAGYAQAVLVAAAYSKQDMGFARSVLERLIQVRPEQALAREMLSRLDR